MEKKLNEIEFAFLKLFIHGVEYQLVKWRKSNLSTYQSQITKELEVQIRYYENKARPDVINIGFNYGYSDKNHSKFNKSLDIRIEERHNGYFQLFRMRELFNKIVSQESGLPSPKQQFENIFIINEIEKADLNKNNWEPPFDFQLLKSAYYNLINQ
jgi:phosphoenolpyruvate synthase/pyruvate phosphate dikinase